VLVTEGDRIGFDRNAVKTDVARMEAALEDGSPDVLSILAGLWRGDLLAGLGIREEAFEDWVRGPRLRLRERVLEGLLRLLEQQARAQPTVAAIETARTILKIDPTHEATHRRLMDLYACRNQRNLALRQYRDCATTLRREFDIAPSAETRRLYEQLLRGHAASTTGQAPAAAAVRAQSGPPAVAQRTFTRKTSDE